MTRIKICGITNRKEIGFLNKYLPEYVGFVFAKSRRQVSTEQAVELVTGLALIIKRAGIFVDDDVEQVATIAERAGLDAVQLHGNENGQYTRVLRSLLKPGTEIWKAIRMDAEHLPDHELLSSMDTDRLLLDTYVEGSNGGAGKCFDWSLAAGLDTVLPIVLAGGLNPDNVKQAIDQISPYAVDTSSGVESEGIKDEQKLKAFIEAVRGGKV